MGQQQLLLVILVTIVVGIATVVAINIFGSSAEQANHDAVRQDLAQIATSAQGWYIKPAMLGGGDNTFSDVDFRKITFPGEIDADDNTISTNLNGTYKISDITDEGFKVTGYPSSQDNYTEGTTTGDWLEAYVTRGNMTASPAVNVAAPGQPEED